MANAIAFATGWQQTKSESDLEIARLRAKARAERRIQNRQVLAKLKGVKISFFVLAGGSGDIGRRVRDIVELRLRQSGISFTEQPWLAERRSGAILEFVLTNPYSLLSEKGRVGIKDEGWKCEARLMEELVIPRNGAKVWGQTWEGGDPIYDPDNEVDSVEKGLIRMESLVNEFCNDFLAANPK